MESDSRSSSRKSRAMKSFLLVALAVSVALNTVWEYSPLNSYVELLRDGSNADQTIYRMDNSEAELRNATQTIEDLKAQVEYLRNQPERQQQQQNATAMGADFDPSKGVCSIFPSGVSAFTASRLWIDYLPQIREASKNPKMPDEYRGESETAFLWKLLTEKLGGPARMRRAIRHLPTFRRDILQNVMQIIERRLRDPSQNPPLQIAVFGGSVTIGRGCIPGRMQFYDCAWPHRLELLLNRFLSGGLVDKHRKDLKIVEVHNLGIGGTASNVGTDRIKYWMYGGRGDLDRFGPDVIINSYSTNDSLPPWDKKWPEDDLPTIVRKQIHQKLETFVRESLRSKPSCAVPPLVIHVDDYLGPQEPDLLGHLAYVQEMTQIAKHYDTMAVSYGEVVRDLVYQNQTDPTFAGLKDVHFGSWAHQTIAWSVGFATLELLINYCDDEYFEKMKIKENEEQQQQQQQQQQQRHVLTKKEMQQKKLYLPPPLVDDFLLENATAEFDAALEVSYRNYVENNCAAAADNATTSAVVDQNPCVASWISTPGNYNADMIKAFMKRHQKSNDGWEAERQNSEGWSNKDGWIATKAGATFRIHFEEIGKEVKTVSVYFLRSYGDKWKDSLARFTVTRVSAESGNDNGSKGNDIVTATPSKVVAEHEIAGIHAEENYKYSLTLSETIQLSETLRIGDTVQLQVDLVGGSHFKIMGMMLCNK